MSAPAISIRAVTSRSPTKPSSNRLEVGAPAVVVTEVVAASQLAGLLDKPSASRRAAIALVHRRVSLSSRRTVTSGALGCPASARR